MKTQDEIKTPLRFTEELDYVKDQVVTREVMSNDSGSVTIVAFYKGTMFARHQVKADVVVYVMEGAVEFEVDDQRQHLEAGQSILLPADTPHTVLALDDSKVLLTKLNA